MSLILDALKRAERERKLEQAPDLSAIYQEGRLNHRKYYPWFWFASAFLAAFGAFVLVFWSKEPSMGDLKDKTPVAHMTSSAPVRPLLSPKDPSPPLPVAKKPVKKAAVPPPVPGGQDKPPKAEPKSDFPKDQTPKPQENGKQIPGAGKEFVGARKKLAAGPVKQFVTSGREKDRSMAAMEVVPAPQPKEALPLISDLPEEIQALLGPLAINVHMYSPNPSERRVFINMRGYREGDAIGDTGFRLVEITSNGVVIDYGEGKAVLDVKMK